MEEEKKGFTVKDKRRIFKEEEEVKESKADESREVKEQPLPPITFSSFIASLSSSALMHLGEIPDLTGGGVKKNLTLAKQTIDVLEMLREKTKGNLDADEEGLLNNVLFDLRVRYVKHKS
ncbi:MAG: hypothetical protein AMJ45_00530 [Syntrophobacter sp. DG_60]|nr:MAG: hypothetical protein AMJ45_00530 [Syntrophobacter sp. DG_60]